MRKITNSSKTQNKNRRHPVHVFVMMCLMIMLGVTNATAQYGGGNGTEGNPYLLSTKAHLTTFFTEVYVNGIYVNNETKVYFRMTSDINMDGTSIHVAKEATKSMKNVVFDGNNYTISNVTNTYSANNTTTAYTNMALFRHITSSTIKNLTLNDFEFHSNKYVGALVGSMTGYCVIENCHIKNGKIYGHNYGPLIVDGSSEIGGLIGASGSNLDLTIKGCSVSNDVKIIFVNNSTTNIKCRNIGKINAVMY
ncbi:hypothetical protein LJC69_06090 [Bacteroidales bacterium OttesenSCG-928-K22]|nr:hypothetical protein [Bacteroidales bacterium OttesenSCG-928-K22]